MLFSNFPIAGGQGWSKNKSEKEANAQRKPFIKPGELLLKTALENYEKVYSGTEDHKKIKLLTLDCSLIGLPQDVLE